MLANLRTYIPLSEAVRRYDLDPGILTRMIEDGRIDAVRTNGDIAVAEEDVDRTRKTMSKRDELWRRVRHLDGRPIGLREGCRKYDFSSPSVYNWINKGYIRVLKDTRGGGRGRKRLLNEADLAYAALVAKERGQQQGKAIFTTEFIPPHSVS
jgi:predicted site-specific integrase-resolvase